LQVAARTPDHIKRCCQNTETDDGLHILLLTAAHHPFHSAQTPSVTALQKSGDHYTKLGSKGVTYLLTELSPS
jgi:hypothetical protein